MGQTTKRFLLVDDDPLNNILTKMILKKSFDNVHVTDYTIPEDCLNYIRLEHNYNPKDGKTTVFLDLNMPTLSGWEFLVAFDNFDPLVKDQYKIYILSSSINSNDINFAKENPHVLDFIEKPLNKAKLDKICG